MQTSHGAFANFHAGTTAANELRIQYTQFFVMRHVPPLQKQQSADNHQVHAIIMTR